MPIGGSANRSEVLNSEFLTGTVTVGNSAVEIKVNASVLEDRQELFILNDSTKTMYLGKSNVTATGATKGLPIEPGEGLNIFFGPDLALYAIAASGNNRLMVWELS